MVNKCKLFQTSIRVASINFGGVMVMIGWGGGWGMG